MENRDIGIIGYGRFGRLLAEILGDEFNIIPYDKNFDTGRTIEEAASGDSLFLCVHIVDLEETLKRIKRFVRPGSMVLDVCSVKLYPEKLLKRYFPGEYLLPTHPMFGPDSAKNGFKKLPMVLCPTLETKKEITDYWFNVFSKRELSVQIMSSDEHDRNTAYSLCLTQFIGRALSQLSLTESSIDTENFRNLLSMRNTAENDAHKLFQGLQTLNPYAEKMREQLIESLLKITNDL